MGTHSPAADWQSKILKKEYQNWLAVGHALSLMLDGLRPYIEREMKVFHQALLANLATVLPCSCPRPTKHTCAWAAQLVRCHRGGRPNSPKWHQSDSTAWTDPHRGYWEVAKLFMSDLGNSKAAVVDANTTDCTGLINLIFWCVHFRVQAHLIEAVRETRNTKWGHAPRQELTDAQKADALIAIRNLLQDPELVADDDAKSALAEIKLMETAFDAQSIERKVLADFQVAVHGQLGDIEGEMREMKAFKMSCKSATKKIQKKQFSLEKRQKKAMELLQSINDRLEDEERRNNSYTTLTWNLAVWTLSKSKRDFVRNLRSVNTKSLSFWIFLVLLLGCFKCLSHNSYSDGCPLEIGDVPFDSKEFNFTSHLNKARESFTGRLWLYRELESVLTESQGNKVGGIVVVGEPGAGKSAFSAQLICFRSSNPYIHKRIIGYHLCKYSDKATQDPGRFVRNLVDLIARRVPEYGMLIHNSSFIPGILHRSCLRDPYDCFEQAIAIPLRKINNEFQHQFIIIDALDECSSDNAGTPLVQFIKDTYSRLPKWMRLVMTSRNDSTVLKHFSSFPKVYLSSSDARNVQDIEVFIANKLFEDAPFLERLKVMVGFRSRDEVSYLTNKLLSQSQGNFLFAKEMLRFWKDDGNNDIDLDKLPKTIGEQYESYLRRAYGSREKFKPALAILEVLVAAFEPMQIKHVFNVLSIQATIDYEYDFVYTLKELSHYVTYGEDNTIVLFHFSFIEWLTSEENLGSPYYVSRNRGHGRLAEYYLSVVKNAPNSSMDIYRFAQHISFDKDGDHYLDKFRNIKATYVNATIDKDNRTLLHIAAAESDKKVLQILSPAFEDIDCEDSYGFTPAFVAAKHGLVENVEYLLSKGANIKHRTKAPPSLGYVWGDPIERCKTALCNSTMMHAAASGGHYDVVRLLLNNNASLNKVNGINLTAIQLAAQNGHLKVAQLLYECGTNVDHLSLQFAAFGGHVDVVAFLLKVGVKDSCMRCDGSFYWLQNRTRYQVTPRHGNGYILSDDMFKILCQSALHLAVVKNHKKVVKLLLSWEDETIHCTDYTGRTPLHEAVRQNHVEIAEALIKSGANVSRKCIHFQNVSFRSSVDLTARTRFSFLVCKAVKQCCHKESRDVKHHLSKYEENEYNKDLCHCGSTPFLLAARYGHVDVGSLLLRYGAEPHDTDCQGATPLHVAACHGHNRFIKWLIAQRPSLHINLKSKNQSTPLHSGAICKTNTDLRPLIEMGASVFETDQFGLTPLHYSVMNPFTNTPAEMFRTCPTSHYIDVNSYLEHSLFKSSEGDLIETRDSRILHYVVPFNFQCQKLFVLTELTGSEYINKVDERGKTTLHLAAQNGEQCCVKQLLDKGARADLADGEGKTPLDDAIQFAHEELNVFLYQYGDCNIMVEDITESFEAMRALNLRYHNAVARILLTREGHWTKSCDERQTYLIHKAFEKQKPFIAYDILSQNSGLLSCKDKKGRSPLLKYLQNGGKWLDIILKRFNVNIHIECGKPFNISEFHLVAFRKPSVPSDNLLGRKTCYGHYCFSQDGPLAKSIKAHPLRYRVIDECRDKEGYTALHRAAQGGNLVLLNRFISWGADPTLLTPQGYSALHLAIMSGKSPFSSFETRKTTEKAAHILLQALRRSSLFDIGCNNGKANLSVYHLSAYAGLNGFVKTLLKGKRLLGFDVNCSNAHGITPLYLAKLHVGTKSGSKGGKDPWQEIVNLIEKHGGVLTYPNREVELNILYRHLFGSHSNPFTLDPSELPNELFYKSEVSQCTEHDFNHYSTGTIINPHQETIDNELLQIRESLNVAKNNFQTIPRDFSELHSFLGTLSKVEKASLDLSRLFSDVLKGRERTKREIIRRRNEENVSTVSITSPTLSLTNKEKLRLLEQTLWEIHFQHESRKAITSNKNRYFKHFLHKHRELFGDTAKFVQLIERSKESELCQDEIFQANFIQQKFSHYVLRCQTDDLLGFMSFRLYKAEFTSKRISDEWKVSAAKDGRTPSWNRALKFLYQQATKRDLTFDYLQVLSLGLDRDTRIQLSVGALYSL